MQGTYCNGMRRQSLSGMANGFSVGSDSFSGQQLTELSLEEIEQFDQTPREAWSDGRSETTKPRRANLKDNPLPSDPNSLGGRASRSLARFVTTVCVGVAVTLAWLFCGGSAKQLIASWAAPQLGWSSALPAMNPPPPSAERPPASADIAAAHPSPPAAQAAVPEAESAKNATIAPTVLEAVIPTMPAARSSELQQLETMAHDVAAMRQNLEQFAAGQEQMAREIARLHPKQDIRRRTSVHPRRLAAPARKPTRTQPAPRPFVVPLPHAPPELALRPPIPVR
jgi:hypothetical protein